MYNTFFLFKSHISEIFFLQILSLHLKINISQLFITHKCDVNSHVYILKTIT